MLQVTISRGYVYVIMVDKEGEGNGSLEKETCNEILIIEAVVDPAVSSSIRLRRHLSRPASHPTADKLELRLEQTLDMTTAERLA